MKRYKRVIESAIVASLLVSMATVSSYAGSGENTTEVNEVCTAEVTTKHQNALTAGIIYDLSVYEKESTEEAGLITASLEAGQHIMVSSSEETDEEEALIEIETEETTEETEETETAAEEETEASAEEETEASAEEETETAAEEETEAAVEEETEASTEEETEASTEEETEAAAEETTEETEETEDSEDEDASEDEEDSEDVSASPSAGVIMAVNNEITESNEEAEAAIAAEEAAEAEAAAAESAAWADKVMASVEDSMNIRAAASEDSEVVGKLSKGDLATVISNDGTWTQITSGNVTGYVKNEYLVYGDDANSLAKEVCSTVATVNTQGLRIRAAASEDAEVLKQVDANTSLEVDTAAETVDGWVAVKYTSDVTGYVSADYVSVGLNLGSALTAEEVAAAEAEKAEEEAKEKRAVAASANEVTLLGALIQTEAGHGSYEGMLAVGSVVMNRVRSGAYPSSIAGVIYQSGQFTPALNGQVDSLVNSGSVSSACLQAAQEVINGTEITGGALQFRSASSGASGTVIGGNVFF
ncbi:MAG: cell wall hydrolase [Lachnospiraceae bacterium]|nr:cell wall hydrolase [Lachnospiraceae bacterium]